MRLIMRGKTCQTQTTEDKNEQGIRRIPKQPKLRWRGRRSAMSSLKLRSKIRKMKNGREDAAKVIWCHDFWWIFVRNRLNCLMSRTRCHVVSHDGSSLHRRRILQRFFSNAGLLLWRHRGQAWRVHLGFVRTDPVWGASAKAMSSTVPRTASSKPGLSSRWQLKLLCAYPNSCPRDLSIQEPGISNFWACIREDNLG